MNLLLTFLEIILYFGILLLMNKLFKKQGVYICMCIASILANIQVCMCVNLVGLSTTLGNVLFAVNFLATDILNEYYGKEEAKTGVKLGIASIIIYIIISQMTLLFTPNEFDSVYDSLKNIFTLNFRVCVSSLVMYAIANYCDVVLYSKLKKLKKWQKNNICTILCNSLENFGFVFLAFAGIYDFNLMLEIAITTTIIEIVIALFDTPFLYLAKPKNDGQYI